MRVLTSSLLGALVVGLLAACTATSTDLSSTSSQDSRQADIANLAFIVWTCTDLECLNLETSETATHAYTACSAVLEDAQNVGIDICEQRKRTSSVVSRPATCVPLGGAACPIARAAYNWDNLRKRPVDEVELIEGDAGSDASGP